MAHNGPESLRHQPCTAETEVTRPFTQPEIAQLAIYLAFEDKMAEADEHLITRDEAVAHMEQLAPVILEGGAA
ncbi:hypothetical protein QM806_04620 [Rhodococcus sp. IEGM 1351]|uniref:hypothetical protein n=1 Tax=Rhodococcus sp. IEGM 1351 TaxID=3047089 RepID=UPI0024B695B0|nr:hypothetical protein [Rhodococcus sp. IEGM 1351]MDI9934739.1 hypothetical protein [Rhodococcus sp. IEGM 1351]